jgi:hypothetical protein
MPRASWRYIAGYVWHTPVKQSNKRLNGVNNPALSQKGIPFEIRQRPTTQALVAIRGEEALWIEYLTI